MDRFQSRSVDFENFLSSPGGEPGRADERSATQLVVNPDTSRRAKASPATLAGGVLLAVAGGLAVQASRVRLRDEVVRECLPAG